VYARAKGAKVDSIAASIILDDFLKSLHQDGPTALMAPTQR
jgi:RNase H-fold protein (predicted Holliday junction resolvase)